MTIKKIATKAYKSSATALWRCGLAAVLVLLELYYVLREFRRTRLTNASVTG